MVCAYLISKEDFINFILLLKMLKAVNPDTKDKRLNDQLFFSRWDYSVANLLHSGDTSLGNDEIHSKTWELMDRHQQLADNIFWNCSSFSPTYRPGYFPGLSEELSSLVNSLGYFMLQNNWTQISQTNQGLMSVIYISWSFVWHWLYQNIKNSVYKNTLWGSSWIFWRKLLCILRNYK